MAAHLSVATALEKNRIASDVAFVIMLEVDFEDGQGNLLETLYLCKNTENIVWQGHTYTAASFDIEFTDDMDSEPELSISGDDPSGFIRERMEAYSGGTGSQARVIVVNTGNLAQEPELLENFEIVAANTQDYGVSFKLGVDNPLARRFPSRVFYQDQCTLRYKGPLCKYAGSLASCDYTKNGANGCIVHKNIANFGGFSGLQTLATQ